MVSGTPVDGPATAAGPPGNVATVVFIGDDPGLVETMRSAAQRRGDAWEVHFAGSGDAGIALVRELPTVDVLVAHVSAAGSPIEEIVSRVRQRSPHTARILLSAPSDRELVVRMVGAAHRYLSLPVDIDVVDEVIEHVRGGDADDLRDPVKALIGQVDRLPSPPAVFQRLSALLAADDWSIGDVANEVANDVGSTGEILKLVNSSFFGTNERVTSIERAISMLGIDLVRFAVLGNTLYRSTRELQTWLDLDRLDRRSKAVAHGARAMAIRERAPSDESAVAYLTGLVSEIGLLVMARTPDISPSIAQPVNVGTYLGAERAIFGGDRFEVGSRLLRLWGFDERVIAAVGHLAGGGPPRDALQWQVVAARRLVMDGDFDPHDLASPAGSRPEVDEALDHLSEELRSTDLAAT